MTVYNNMIQSYLCVDMYDMCTARMTIIFLKHKSNVTAVKKKEYNHIRKHMLKTEPNNKDE